MEWIKRVAARWADAVQAGPERFLTKDERTETINKIAVRADAINGAIYDLNMKAYGKGWGYVPCPRDPLSKYSDRTLIMILDYMMQDTVGHLPLRDKSSFMRQITRLEPDTDETTIREFIALQPYIQMITNIGPHNYFGMLRAIHEYAPIPAMRDYSDADYETKRQIAALITVTANMYQEYVKAWNDDTYSEQFRPSHLAYLPLEMSGGTRISDEKIMNLVMELPDKAESIATIIIEDKISDAAFIRDRVLCSSQSLREGVL